MNYATGQRAEILRLQPAWTNWPEHPEMPFYPRDRVVRVVPLTQRAPWRPWPWRTWGWPQHVAPIPADPYAYGWEGDAVAGDYAYANPAWRGPRDGWGPDPYLTGQQLEIVGPSPHVHDILAGARDIHTAAQTLVDAIHAGAARRQPPARGPTFDFQVEFNAAFGALGGLGTSQRPELLKLDGIYGPRTEMALSHVLGGVPQLMAMYGSAPGSAAAGATPPGIATIDQAVESLASILFSLPGIVMLHSDASQRVILVFVQPGMDSAVRSYVDQLRGTWQGFPIAIHFSGPILPQ
jgi:hypothetical protein